jgi:hypothetical protein
MAIMVTLTPLRKREGMVTLEMGVLGHWLNCPSCRSLLWTLMNSQPSVEGQISRLDRYFLAGANRRGSGMKLRRTFSAAEAAVCYCRSIASKFLAKAFPTSILWKQHLLSTDKPQLPPLPTAAAEPVLLILADISGYTRYMTANAKTLSHSHTIIAELIQAIASAIEIPLEIVELEGDAIFLFCRKPGDPATWQAQRELVYRKLLEFFHRFRARLQELRRSNVCTCHACANIDQLRLKVLVHSGEVLVHRVLQFNKLSGVDVILIHRLLKNSVERPEYLLLTEAAHRDLQFPTDVRFETGSEQYEHLGSITTFVHYLEAETASRGTVDRNLAMRYRQSFGMFLKLWFGQLAWRRATRSDPHTHRSPLANLGLSLATLLLTPLFVPAGAFLALIHAWRSGQHLR